MFQKCLISAFVLAESGFARPRCAHRATETLTKKMRTRTRTRRKMRKIQKTILMFKTSVGSDAIRMFKRYPLVLMSLSPFLDLKGKAVLSTSSSQSDKTKKTIKVRLQKYFFDRMGPNVKLKS